MVEVKNISSCNNHNCKWCVFFKWFPGGVDAIPDVAEEIPTLVGRGRGRLRAHVDAISDVAEEIPTLVGRGRGRRRAYVDALSDDKADKEIPTTDGRGRGRVGRRKYFVLKHPQL